MNEYISKMKHQLTTFSTVSKDCEQKREDALKKYRDDIARDYIVTVDQEQQTAFGKAENVIRAISADALAAVDKWAVLDGSKITDDIKLLKGGFDLTAGQLKELIERHHNNATMLAAIQKYCDDNKIGVSVPTADERRVAWGKITKSALEALRYINSGSLGWMGSSGVDALLETWGYSLVDGDAVSVVG